jgi:teichuronic acid biosynthesis glycosyltransferase TuaC
MKVLFVASGNSLNFEIAPFIFSQGVSLKKYGIDVSYFTVKGKGIAGYLTNIKNLRTYLSTHQFDLIHAHYSLCGWFSVLTFTKLPIVLSLMGDDAYGEYTGPDKILFRSRFLKLLTLAVQPFVQSIISKSKNIDCHVYRRKTGHIIPNGVSLETISIKKDDYPETYDFTKNKKRILFLSSKNDVRKNYDLAQKAVNLLNDPDIELLAPYPISHSEVVKYLCMADVLVFTSFMEGSPNVIKEAMACNCPIVSTDVGDIKWVIGNTEGCYIAGFDPLDFSEKLKKAIEFASQKCRTKGRNRIIELGLDSETVARRIVDVYESVLGIGD